MTSEITEYHRQVARQLVSYYAGRANAPAGWRETVSWHWIQAGAYAEAADVGLEVVEEYINRLDFISARRWTERTLEVLDRLGVPGRHAYDLRAYTVAVAVLEFGGQYREALGYARRMLRITKDLRSRGPKVQALMALGRMQRELGLLTDAEATLQQARSIAESEEAGVLEAEVRFHLAKVHQLQGRHIEALQELQLAQEEHAQADDQMKLARVLTAIGDVYRVLGAARQATVFYTRALGLEQGRGNARGQAILKDKMALALLAQGRLPEAEAIEQESLDLRQLIGDIVGQARSHSVLGMIAGRMGQHERAIEHHERARELEEQTQNQRGHHMALLHLGDEALALRRFNDANAYYRRALALATSSGDQIALVRTFERQGDLSAEQGRRDHANAMWSEALHIREALGHADEAASLRERIRTGSRL